MADKSTVKVTYLGDASALAKASAKARGELDKVGGAAEKADSRSKRAFGGMGASAKAGVAGLMAGGLVAGGKAAFDMAAQMELMDAKSKTVFGDQIGVVQKWAAANANAMGLTKKEATGLAAGFADLLIPMGFTREQAAKMSTETVGLSGALSEWSGGKVSAAEASDVLAKAMLGERDGLKALGISITEEDVKNRLLKNGKDKLTGASLEQAKAEATQQLISEKSSDAQAAYAKNTDTLARKKSDLTAKTKELRDKAIGALVPVLLRMGSFISTRVVPAIRGMIEQFRGGTGAGGKLREAADRVRDAFERNRPTLEKIGKAFAEITTFVVTKVVPMLVDLYSRYLSGVFDMATKVATAIGKIVDKCRDAIQAIRDFGSAVKDSPVGKAAGFLGDVGGAVGDAFTNPGRFVGGGFNSRATPSSSVRSRETLNISLNMDGKVVEQQQIRRDRLLGRAA